MAKNLEDVKNHEVWGLEELLDYFGGDLNYMDDEEKALLGLVDEGRVTCIHDTDDGSVLWISTKNYKAWIDPQKKKKRKWR